MLKLHTYQLGTPRRRGEGLRIGVIRHLPRGVRKEDYARLDHFDVGFPTWPPALNCCVGYTRALRRAGPDSSNATRTK